MADSTFQIRVVRTPEPPYYSVTTTAELGAEFDQSEHMRRGMELYRHARAIDGFIGLEAFYDGNASIAVSYWRDLQAIQIWSRHPAHLEAKAIARDRWFGATITRIARVERDYGFNLG